MRGLFGTVALAAAFVLAATLGSACSDGGGAISVRWRVIDLQSGVGYDPRTFDGPGGVCTCPDPGTPGRPSDCAPSYGWTVHRVEVELTDQATDLPVLVDDERLIFNCSAREGTTPFIVPTGTYGIRIRAVDPARQSCLEGHTPPTVTRNVRKGDIVNLDVVEVGILYPPAPDSCDAL